MNLEGRYDGGDRRRRHSSTALPLDDLLLAIPARVSLSSGRADSVRRSGVLQHYQS